MTLLLLAERINKVDGRRPAGGGVFVFMLDSGLFPSTEKSIHGKLFSFLLTPSTPPLSCILSCDALTAHVKVTIKLWGQ